MPKRVTRVDVEIMTDPAERSQALTDSRRAEADLATAKELGASSSAIASLAKVRAAADDRLRSIRLRGDLRSASRPSSASVTTGHLPARRSP
jgi:hypothetical protein